MDHQKATYSTDARDAFYALISLLVVATMINLQISANKATNKCQDRQAINLEDFRVYTICTYPSAKFGDTVAYGLSTYCIVE